jgi:signal transduction histidine kinase
LPKHDEAGLQVLADRVAETIRAHQLQQSARNAHAALDVMAYFLRDNFHKLANSVQNLRADIERLQNEGLRVNQVEAVCDARDRLQEMIRLFKRVERAGRQTGDPRREKCQIDDLLQEVLDKIRGRIKTNKIRLELNIQPVKSYVDSLQIQECFESILDNAVKAMPTGGWLELTLRTAPELRMWMFEARDTGPGIRWNKDGTAVQQNTDGAAHSGIGIFLTQLFCNSHNGRMVISSPSGGGTTVSVWIPLTETGKQLAWLTPVRQE